MGKKFLEKKNRKENKVKIRKDLERWREKKEKGWWNYCCQFGPAWWSLAHKISTPNFFFLVPIKSQSFLFSLKWISINIIIIVTIVICKINHLYRWKFSKSTTICYASITTLYQWKFLKSTTVCYVSTTPTHVVYASFIQCKATYLW